MINSLLFIITDPRRHSYVSWSKKKKNIKINTILCEKELIQEKTSYLLIVAILSTA